MTQPKIKILRPNATDAEVRDHLKSTSIKRELERLYDATYSLRGIEKILTAIIDSEGTESDWPLRENDYVKGALGKTLLILGDYIEHATGNLERLVE